MPKSLTEDQWETFFSLLHRVVTLDGQWEDKKREVIAAAVEDGEQAESDVEEFCSWWE